MLAELPVKSGLRSYGGLHSKSFEVLDKLVADNILELYDKEKAGYTIASIRKKN